MIQKTLRTYSPKSRRRKFVIDENLYTYLFIQHRDRLSTKESRLNLSPFESLIKGNSPGFLFSSATHSLESIERRFPDESFSPPTGRVLAEKMGELPKSSTYPLTFILIHSLSLPLLSLSLSFLCKCLVDPPPSRIFVSRQSTFPNFLQLPKTNSGTGIG